MIPDEEEADFLDVAGTPCLQHANAPTAQTRQANAMVSSLL